MSSGGRLSSTSQAFGAGAKVSGTVMRLFQFDADHHSAPTTAVSPKALSTSEENGSPGAYRPVFSHWPTSAVASSPGAGSWSGGSWVPEASQLTPMIGITTSAHGTVWEQPSDAFCCAVQTTKLARPVPSVAVGA